MTEGTHLAKVETSKPLTKWQMSEQGFSRAFAILKIESLVTERTPLLPPTVIDAMIYTIEQEQRGAKINEAVVLTDTLLGQNPSYNPHNPKVYYNAIVALFTAFPLSIGRMAVHKVEGLVANLGYEIKPSDLKSFLDKRLAERNLVLMMAYRMKAEHARRAKLQDDPIENERRLMTPEQRRERAAMILAGIKPPPIFGT